MDDHQRVLEKLTDIQLTSREIQTQTAMVLTRLEDHEARLRVLEQRKGFWTVMAAAAGAVSAYFLSKFKH